MEKEKGECEALDVRIVQRFFGREAKGRVLGMKKVVDEERKEEPREEIGGEEEEVELKRVVPALRLACPPLSRVSMRFYGVNGRYLFHGNGLAGL